MCYPGLRGRLSTCYSPVRRSGVPKDLTARLACLKRAASVRSEPGSNSPLSETREQVPVLISFLLQFILSYSHEPALIYFSTVRIFRIDRSSALLVYSFKRALIFSSLRLYICQKTLFIIKLSLDCLTKISNLT